MEQILLLETAAARRSAPDEASALLPLGRAAGWSLFARLMIWATRHNHGPRGA
jgi:hypothetical protein